MVDPRGSGLLFFMFIRPHPYTCLGIECQGSAPTPRPSQDTTSIGPHAGSSYNWPPRAPEQLRPVPRAPGPMKSTLIVVLVIS